MRQIILTILIILTAASKVLTCDKRESFFLKMLKLRQKIIKMNEARHKLIAHSLKDEVIIRCLKMQSLVKGDEQNCQSPFKKPLPPSKPQLFTDGVYVMVKWSGVTHGTLKYTIYAQTEHGKEWIGIASCNNTWLRVPFILLRQAPLKLGFRESFMIRVDAENIYGLYSSFSEPSNKLKIN